MTVNFRRWRCGAKVVLLGVGLCAFMGCSTLRVERWQPAFTGVDITRGEAREGKPRLQQVSAVRIDLHDPDIVFLASPSNGDAPLETTSETTSAFLLRHHLQVAVNANFFEPCCAPGDKDLLGLAVSRGDVVSLAVATGLGAKALILTRENRARIVATVDEAAVVGAWTAVAGSEIVLARGRKTEWPATDFNRLTHPRTAVGVSRNGRYLIVVVIDGRQPGYSMGATMDEVAAWLRRLGAYDGLNLDGGGSTTLVRAEDEKAVVLNRPSGAARPAGDGSENQVTTRPLRSVGNSLGVFAKPLPAAH